MKLSLRGVLTTKQSRGLFLLLVFWMVCWFLPSRLLQPLRQTQGLRNDNLGILGPFTTAEKILLGTPLSFNELSEQDWELLPGIGPATAKKIVTYRRSHGPLRSLEELDAVSGIGPKTISAIRSLAFRPAILEEHSDSDQSANPGND